MRSLSSRRFLGATALAACLALGLPVTADAATPNQACPSSNCVAVGPDLGQAYSATPDGHGSALVSSRDGSITKVDLTTGAARTVATGLGNLRGVSADGAGTVYTGVFDGRVVEVNSTTGSSAVIADGLGSVLSVFYHDGHVYAGGVDGVVWDLVAGQAPRQLATGLGGIMDLAAAGGRVWVVSFTGEVASVDAVTGARTDFGGGDLYEPNAVSVAPGGTAYFVAGTGDFHRIDTATGSTPLLARFYGISPLDFEFQQDGTALALDSSGWNARLWKITGPAS
ncbi:hypothetical protein ACWEOE_13405 [Amycolatopsis sp. NPDC004368]